MNIRVEFVSPRSYVEDGKVVTPSATVELRDIPDRHPLNLNKEELETWLWRNMAALHAVLTSCDITHNNITNFLWKANAGYRELIKDVMEEHGDENSEDTVCNDGG